MKVWKIGLSFVAVVLIVGRAIAWKATGASVDDTMADSFWVLGDALAGLVGRRRHCLQC